MNRSPSIRIGFSLGLALAIASTGACGIDEPSEGDDVACETGRCDGLPFPEQLVGREDPIGKFFRLLSEKDVIDKDGVYHADRAGDLGPTDDNNFYAKLLEGLATVQGCQPSSAISYALSDDLVTGTPYPRLISTVCSDSNDMATNAFVATTGSPGPDGDLDVDNLEFFAWDATKGRYFFYATNQGSGGNLEVEVDPLRCAKCHETHADVDPIGMPRLPIMNELTKPWTHWDAGPGGVSESFKIPDGLGQNWARYGSGKIAAASRFEKVIRDANALRVAPSRSKLLFRPAKLEDAMGLIRPLFCDEQTNYVSELATGEVVTDAVIAGGIKGAFRTIQPTWPFEWFNNDNIQLPPAPADQQLFVMPVRGVAEVTFEAQLGSILTPAQILAVRALDWKKPTFSTMRCDMWRDAFAAFQADPPKLSARNRDAVKVLYDEIMKHAGMSTRDLAAGKFVVLDDGNETSVKVLKDAVASGNLPTECGAQGFCLVDANGFGTHLQEYVTALETDPNKRAELLAERDRRVCATQQDVATAGTHTQHGSRSKRVPNEPSFARILDGNEISTLPASCN